MESNPSARLVPSMERASHAVSVWIEAELRDTGISQAEAHVLGYMTQVGRCSINDLHHDFGHRRSTLTSILDRLEGRDLLRRLPHPSSRRSVMLELTDRGLAAGHQVTALVAVLETFVRRETAAGDLEGFYRVIKAIEEGAHDRR